MKRHQISDKRDVVIIMTATVDPGGTENTVLQNSLIRKKQYLDAINFYLQNTDIKIVFCENTGCNFYEEIISPDKAKRLEYLTFNGNNYDKRRGKGYGEAKILDYALKRSKFIKESKYIIKITGRVKISNIGKILNSIRYSDGNFLAIEGWKPGWIHSVCFGCCSQWLSQTLNNFSDKLDDKEYNFQQMLYDSVLSSKAIKIKSIHPIIEGISGKTALPYINNIIPQRKLDNFNTLSTIYRNQGAFIPMILSKTKWFLFRIIVKCCS